MRSVGSGRFGFGAFAGGVGVSSADLEAELLKARFELIQYVERGRNAAKAELCQYKKNPSASGPAAKGPVGEVSIARALTWLAQPASWYSCAHGDVWRPNGSDVDGRCRREVQMEILRQR